MDNTELYGGIALIAIGILINVVLVVRAFLYGVF